VSENRFYEILRHKPGKELLRLLSFWKEERNIYVFEAFVAWFVWLNIFDYGHLLILRLTI